MMFQNFIILPLTFLFGVFYSIHSLGVSLLALAALALWLLRTGYKLRG